jgi:hypothetical protein
MKEGNITFTVEAITQLTDRLIIGGRCGDIPFKVGTTFEVIYRYPPARTLEDYGKFREHIDERPIALHVETIHSYGHFLNELPPGMTAEITLVGRGGDLLQQGDVLGKIR